MAVNRTSKAKGKVVDIPANAPTIGAATDSNDGSSASVAFTAPSTTTGGPIFSYTAISDPGSFSNTGTSSPITVSGLTLSTAYTFTVAAVNPTGNSAYSAASNSVTPTSPDRGFFTAGIGAQNYKTTEYINIATTGNGTNFGNTVTHHVSAGAVGSSTRILTIAGWDATTGLNTGTVEYFTIASSGSGTSFGSVTPTYLNDPGSCSSSTRGVIGGGHIGSNTGVIEYFTIASTGNATNFGACTVASSGGTSASNATRGIRFVGNAGGTNSDAIEYMTIATTGNAVSFGTSSVAKSGAAAVANGTRVVFGGGNNGNGQGQTGYDYVTIATTGNTTSFGTLFTGRRNLIGMSGSHGGI